MDKEFLNAEQSQEIKDLGFNESCFAYWDIDPSFNDPILVINKHFPHKFRLPAPTYSQAFRWIRQEYGYNCYIRELIKGKFTFFINKYEVKNYVNDFFLPYEEAESRCFDKLIEIINLNQ